MKKEEIDYNPYPDTILETDRDIKREVDALVNALTKEYNKEPSETIKLMLYNSIRSMVVQGYNTASHILNNGKKTFSMALIELQFQKVGDEQI
jgi:hypothetical protein